MNGIDEAITQVERLYRSITGREAASTETPYAPIPPEREPQEYVEMQLDRLLEALGPARAEPSFVPPIGVMETAQELVVHVDVPGVPRDAIEVSVDSNAIVVSGRRPPMTNGAHTNGEGRAHHPRVSERPFGAFRRVISMPTGVAPEQASALLRDGVLEVRVPRGASALGGGVHRLSVT